MSAREVGNLLQSCSAPSFDLGLASLAPNASLLLRRCFCVPTLSLGVRIVHDCIKAESGKDEMVWVGVDGISEVLSDEALG